ncbi:hypothetical protein EDC04DRAFT_2687203 [Pisolithus marmoratus]|nr:hypothetical protein EDC04DRAFT_2687203 [Pisolithus marmoratus]
MDTVAGNPLIIDRAAHDRVSYATRDSAAGTQLERMCMKAELLCTLTFPEGAGPSTNELATLLYVTSKQRPKCNLTDIQCYWFVGTVFGALRSLFEGASISRWVHLRFVPTIMQLELPWLRRLNGTRELSERYHLSHFCSH